MVATAAQLCRALTVIAWMLVVLPILPAAGAAVEQRGAAGAATLTATLDRVRVGLGDRLTLRLVVRAPAGSAVNFSDVGPGLSNLRQIHTEKSAPVLLSGQSREWLRTITLEADGVGTARVEGLLVHVLVPGAAAADAVGVAPLEARVTTVLPADADLSKPREIAGPLALPAPARTPPYGLLLVAVAIGVAAVCFAWWRRRAVAPGAGPTPPADRVALDALAGLQVASGMTEREIELFYRTVATILRQYIAHGFDLNAPCRTTQELLAAVAGSNTAIAGSRPLLEPLLVDCDLVKFARSRPDAHAMQQLLHRAADFIAGTAASVMTPGGRAAAS